MGAGGREVVGTTWQRGRDPQQPACRVGDGLHVHPVSAVLGRVVRAAIPDALALGEGAVQQDEVRIGLPQDFEQARRAVREQVDDRGGVGVCGADGDTEARRDLGEGVVPAQVHQSDQGTPVWRELAGAVTLAGDDEHGYPLDQGVGKDE